MHISTLGESPEGFYIVEARDLYEGLIDPQIMTQEQLMDEMIEGIKQYNILFPPRTPAWWEKAIPILMMAGAAGVAVAMSGTVVAAGGVAAGTGTTTTAAGATATGAVGTKAGAVALAQKAATSVATSAAVKKAAATVAGSGGDTSSKLSLAANLWEKAKKPITNAVTGWVTGQIQKANGALDQKAQNALMEMVNREAEDYMNWMRREAAEREQLSRGPVAKPKVQAPPIPWTTIVAVATPFLLLMVRR